MKIRYYVFEINEKGKVHEEKFSSLQNARTAYVNHIRSGHKPNPWIKGLVSKSDSNVYSWTLYKTNERHFAPTIITNGKEPISMIQSKIGC